MIPEVGFEPTRPQRTLDFESSASASSATPAKNFNKLILPYIRFKNNDD